MSNETIELRRQLEEIKTMAERMFKADAEYGCGFYSYGPWCDAYAELSRLVGCYDDVFVHGGIASE